MNTTQYPSLIEGPIEVLAAIDRLLSGLDVDSLDGCSDMELVGVMRAARRLHSRMEAVASVATQKVDARQASMKAAGTPTASLISLDENRSVQEARGQVCQARDLAKHQAPRQAALDGTITTAHAAAISKGIADLPELPEDVTRKVAEAFVTKAKGVSPKKLARLAHSVLAEVAPELALDEDSMEERAVRQRERAVKNRTFSWGNDGEGSVWFAGQLPEAEAEPLVRTLSALVAAGKREERDHAAQLRQSGADPLLQHTVRKVEERRTQVQRQADALVTLINDYTAGGRATRRGPRALIRVTISLDDLVNRAGVGGVLDSGTELAPGQLRRLAAEADIIPFVLGGNSEILDQGEACRLVPPEMRAALELRDNGCIFPGCSKPPEECEAHHVDPWRITQSTRLEEVALLCAHHHGIIEPDRRGVRDQWRIEFDAGRPVVIAPKRLTLSA